MHVAVHGVALVFLLIGTAGPGAAQQQPAPGAQAPPADTASRPTPPRPAPRPDRWKFGAEFSFTDQSGNKALRILTGGLKFAHRDRESFEMDGNLQSRYGKSDGEVVARNYFASVNLSPRSTDLWAPSLSFRAERDPFKRLDVRFSAGAGAKLTPYQEAGSTDEVSVSLRLAYEFTNLRLGETLTEPEIQHRPRWTMEVQGAQQLRPGITAQHQSSFEPSWGELANYLLRSQTGLKILLTKRLALSVEHQLNRTSQPPAGVEPDDRLFKTGIIIDF